MTAALAPVEIRYQPRGVAVQLFECRVPEVVLSGPAGTGKTRAWLERLHLLAADRYPGMRALIVRKVAATLATTALVTFEKKVRPDLDGVVFFGGSKNKPPAYRYPNGSEIVIGGMDNPDKIMSSDYDLVYVPEATDLTEADWETLTTRLRNWVIPYQQLGGDCNPRNPEHWLKRRADRGQTLLLESRHTDNPEIYGEDGSPTVQGQDYLEKLSRLTGVRHERLFEGRWTDVKGALWNRADLNASRVQKIGASLNHVIVAVDPSGGDTEEHDEQGIVAVGLGDDGHIYVLADYSDRLDPDGWGRKAIACYHDYAADCIVAETNYGGDLVMANIATVAASMKKIVSTDDVHATRGKAVRAEPVASMWSPKQQRAHMVGTHPELEDQLCNWLPNASRYSPDRLDAMVWAITYLLQKYQGSIGVWEL